MEPTGVGGPDERGAVVNHYRATISMELEVPDPELLRRFAHEDLTVMAESDPGAREALGPAPTRQDIVAYYANSPTTVVSAVLRVMIQNGLLPVMVAGTTTVDVVEVQPQP
jgi:hypothetical protein